MAKEDDGSAPPIATNYFESELCKPTGIVISLIIWVVIFTPLLVISFFLPSPYRTEYTSTWQCPASLTDFDPELCAGTDLRSFNSSNPVVFRSNYSQSSYREVYFELVPQTEEKEIGLNMKFNISYSVDFVTLGKSKSDIYNTSIVLQCRHHSTQCEPVFLYSGIPRDYNITLYYVSDETEVQTAVKTITKDAKIKITSGNPAASIVQVIFRYVFMAITLILLIFFFIKMCIVPGKTIMEQRWLAYLAIAAIIHDNPLYALQFGFSAFALSVLDALFSSFFNASIMLYLLIILGGFITRKPTFLKFTLPRLILIIIYFICDAVSAITTLSDQTIDAIANNTIVQTTASILLMIVYVIWAFWFLYTVVRCIVIARKHDRAIKGRYRVFVIYLVVNGIIIMLPIAFQRFFGISIRSQMNLVLRMTADLFIWILLIWLAPTRREKSTRRSIHTALNPKVDHIKDDPTGTNAIPLRQAMEDEHFHQEDDNNENQELEEVPM
ncbi:putative Wnt-binding factor required for Wnt secretion [Blattamonas nauphoetae]|uniref:Wnt-binding factor required for Wnt secretion n=1 Tax=Blattamonas nauphoetae TaxID=2049346 RepID=A0ABQ9WV19_9EUKA|nr:putative Wnt-binding factor required for Wnt secretion [Blattamonas nauphoetae]